MNSENNQNEQLILELVNNQSEKLLSVCKKHQKTDHPSDANVFETKKQLCEMALRLLKASTTVEEAVNDAFDSLEVAVSKSVADNSNSQSIVKTVLRVMSESGRTHATAKEVHAEAIQIGYARVNANGIGDILGSRGFYLEKEGQQYRIPDQADFADWYYSDKRFLPDHYYKTKKARLYRFGKESIKLFSELHNEVQ